MKKFIFALLTMCALFLFWKQSNSQPKILNEDIILSQSRSQWYNKTVKAFFQNKSDVLFTKWDDGVVKIKLKSPFEEVTDKVIADQLYKMTDSLKTSSIENRIAFLFIDAEGVEMKITYFDKNNAEAHLSSQKSTSKAL